MFLWLVTLFVALPALELLILIRVGQYLGFPGTLALILLTGVMGAALARYEGLQTLQRIRQSLASGTVPTNDVVEGVLILAAGLVLITPGLLTDTAGFLLLVAPFRRAVRALLIRHFRARMQVVQTGPTVVFGEHSEAQLGRDGVIDVEAKVLDDD